MIKSMTGFGRAESVTSERKITVELKSVNHRYLDLNIKMPKKLGRCDPESHERVCTAGQGRRIYYL